LQRVREVFYNQYSRWRTAGMAGAKGEIMNRMCIIAALAAGSTMASANILVVDSGNDVVSLLNGFNGSVIQQNFLDINAAAAAEGYTGSLTPKEAIEIGGEIWVSDQVADRIWRFDSLTGQPLGSVGSGELNNIRGMEVVGNQLFISQGSAGTSFSEGIVVYDLNANAFTGSFNGGFADGDISYNDVLFYNGELLVTDSDSDSIDRYDLSGNFLGLFAESDGLTDFDFAQQMTIASNGNLLVGGFSLPAGVYAFQPDGTALGIVAGQDIGPRGAIELGNGEILYSGGINLRTDNGIILGGAGFNFQYFTATTIPAPGAGVALLMGLGAIARRRR
jgi:hypothetical protein